MVTATSEMKRGMAETPIAILCPLPRWTESFEVGSVLFKGRSKVALFVRIGAVVFRWQERQ